MSQWTDVLRWILMIPISALCIWASLFNWSVIYREFIKQEVKVPSIGAFGGEMFGIIAITLCPVNEIHKLWSMPLIFGGTFFYFLLGTIFSLKQKFYKNT